MAAALVVALWASAFIGVKVAVQEVEPGQLALLRYLVASLALLALLPMRRVPLPSRRDLPRLFALGALGIALYNLLLNYGQQRVSAGIAAVLINTVPILTSLLSISFLGEKIRRGAWAGTLVSFVGVCLIGLERGGWSGFDGGTLLVLAAALAQAGYFVLARPLLARYHPIDLTSWATWLGCLCLTPWAGGVPAALSEASSTALVAILFLGVGPAALAYVAWSYVLAAVDPGRASNALFAVPVLALLLGWGVLGEQVSAVSGLGVGWVLAGFVLSRLRR
ncbi:hypothetical protein ABI59_19140 [Acidobacteria bacterium Mor1]|nr:hypothetical protein ABI59_19140 [Acidobacteria bacterium Mor1]